ncbi:MAG: thermosome subunit [archaeon]|nr:thermosome subunit [archaeon]
MALYGVPIVLKEGAETQSGNKAVFSNITAVRAVSEAIKSTFGPKGLSKMMVDSFGEATVTDDSYTILDELDVEHPAAKLVIDLSKSMNKNVGDGITKAVILTGELLGIGKELLEQKLHPNIIIQGFSNAQKKIIEIIEKLSLNLDINDKDKIQQIALTALNTKSTFGAAETIANLVTESILKITEIRDDIKIADLDFIQIIKKEGDQLKNSSFIDGVIVDKEVVNSTMPKIIHNAKIAVIDHSLEITKTEFDTDIKIADPSQIVEFKKQEDSMIKNLVDIIAETGANVVFCQKGIDDLAQHYLAEKGIMAIRRVKRSDLTKLIKATHATKINDIKGLTSNDLGKAEIVEEKRIGKDKMIFVSKCENPKSISILIRGGTRHIIEEAERSLKNCLGVVKDIIEHSQYVPGAGAIETELAKQIRNYAKTINTRESIAIESYAAALEIIPICLADNSGLNPMEIMANLHSEHEKKDGNNIGIDLKSKKTINSIEKGIIEPSIILKQALKSATELSIMLLRIDEIISASKHGSGPQMPGAEDDFDD